MMDAMQATSVTGQGFGTPEPVVSGSERVGSLRPSASDRSKYLVGNQAFTATGTKEEDIFRRKGIHRTPPPRERVYSCPDALDLDEGMTSLQKVVANGEATFDQIKQLEKEEKEALDKLGKNILAINAIVKEARNIHKTIRDSITAAVIYYHRTQECRESLTLARETAIGNGSLSSTVPTEKRNQETQSSPILTVNSEQASEGKKRNASSPLDPTTRDKKKTKNHVAQPVRRQISKSNTEVDSQQESETETEWDVVKHKEKKKRQDKRGDTERIQKKRRLPEAVAVKTKTLSYLDALKNIKSKVDPDKLGITVSGIRQTRSKEILIELKGGTDKIEALKGTLAEAFGEEATVRTMNRAVTLDIRDIDATVEKEEVTAAIKSAVGETDPESIKVQALRKGFGETQVAVVTMSPKAATVVLKTGRLRIGWVLCRIREKTKILRCYRCLGFGHMAPDCKGPDHTKTCRLCGKNGHIAKNCKGEEVFCVVCSRTGQSAQHILGSRYCEAFRKELNKAKK